MAELSSTPRISESAAGADQLATERVLRARIAELEALVAARTQAIVGMGARLAELEGDAPPAISAQLRSTEAQLAQLRATKVIRYSQVPRQIYGRLRALGGFGRG